MFPVPGRLLSSQTGFFSHTIDGIFHLPAGVRQHWGCAGRTHNTHPEFTWRSSGSTWDWWGFFWDWWESPGAQSCQLTKQTLRAFPKEQSKIDGGHRRTHLTTLNIKQAPNFKSLAVLKDRHQCHPTPTIHQGISLPWALVTKYNISLNILFILAYVLGNTLILENWLASSF